MFRTSPTSLLLARASPGIRLWLPRGRRPLAASHCSICSRCRHRRSARHRRPRTRSRICNLLEDRFLVCYGDLLLLAGVLHEVVIVRHGCGVGGEVEISAAMVVLNLEGEAGVVLLVRWIEVFAVWCCPELSRLVCLGVCEAAVGAYGRAPLSRG
jgi:hypothetical protein